MTGNAPAQHFTASKPAHVFRLRMARMLSRVRLADASAVVLLTSVAAIQSIAYWRAGLSYSPDSGFYLLYAARLHEAGDYAAGAAMYAPMFPAIVALAMIAAPYPGQAAVLVLGVSTWVALLSIYWGARLCRAPVIVALAFALLLFTLPSTTHVLGYAWTEGMMLAVLLFVCACYTAWTTTRRAPYLALVLIASAAAPLVKYVAIYVPVLTTLLVLPDALRQPSSARRARLLGSCALMFLPSVAHGFYNYHRWGTVTGHGPAKITLRENASDLAHTLASTLGPAGLVLVSVTILAGLCALAWTSRRSRDVLASPLIATLAYGCGFLICLVFAASAAQVDRLDQRLVAPGFGPLLLASAQSAGIVCSAAHPRRGVLFATACVIVALCLLAGHNPAKATYALLSSKLHGDVQYVPAFESGFTASAAHSELSEFYAEQLTAAGCLSVTMVNAESPLGRVRREWFAIAEALAGPALTGGRVTRLTHASREKIAIAVDREPMPRLIFVPARIPELQRLRPHTRAERDDAGPARVNDVMGRIAQQARVNGCARHWVIVPSAAAWFRVENDQHFGSAVVREQRMVGSFRAISMQFGD